MQMKKKVQYNINISIKQVRMTEACATCNFARVKGTSSHELDKRHPILQCKHVFNSNKQDHMEAY